MENERQFDGLDNENESLEVASDDLFADDKEIQHELASLYSKCCADDRYPRLVEVKDVKQAEFYWSGRHYIWWSSKEKSWQLPTQAQAVNYGDLDLDDMPRFEFVTNIYQARGLMMIGAVAGAPPRIRFFPANADDENDLEIAEARTKEARLIQRWNPQQVMLQDEAYHAWTGGIVAYWAHYVSADDKVETSLLKESEETVESSILCPQCGWSAPAAHAEPPVPCPQCGAPLTEDNIVEEEPISIPEDENAEQEEQPERNRKKGRVVISTYGALNFKRPQHVQHQSQFHYCAIEEEVHYAILREANPDKADEIRPGMAFGAEDTFERNARLSVAENTKLLTQTGSAQKSLCTYARVWFRPSAFWMIDDKKIRDKVIAAAPRGCRVEFSGTTYLKAEAESMDDCIVTCHAMPGRGQHRPAVGSSTISVNDRVNTFSNIEAETYEYGIPITYRASDTFSSDANDDQRAAPGLECEVALRDGQDIRQRIMQVRADTVSPTMQKHEADLIGPVSDMLSGTYPALTGAGEGSPDTLGQQAMQRDQAMGRMGVFYVNLKQAHADILTLACRILEQRSDDEKISIPVIGASGDFENESIDVTALEGEAEAYPEGDENFPELWNQQRATMMQIMDTPYGQALSGEMANAELFGRLTGIPDLKIPHLDAWRKQLKEINELTKIPEGDELLAGVAPMIEVTRDDFHQVEADCCQFWINSAAGQKMKRENPMGVQAVSDHRQQHIAQIPQQPPAEKPLNKTVTTALKDMPPEAQAQYLAKELGIKVGPNDFVQQALLEHFKKSIKPATGAPNPKAQTVSGPSNSVAGQGV